MPMLLSMLCLCCFLEIKDSWFLIPDVLVRHGARAPTTMIMTMLNRDKSVPNVLGLIICCLKTVNELSCCRKPQSKDVIRLSLYIYIYIYTKSFNRYWISTTITSDISARGKVALKIYHRSMASLHTRDHKTVIVSRITKITAVRHNVSCRCCKPFKTG